MLGCDPPDQGSERSVFRNGITTGVGMSQRFCSLAKPGLATSLCKGQLLISASVLAISCFVRKAQVLDSE